MIHETIEESIIPVKDYIIHAHMGNTVIKSPDCEAYGDNHPRFGFPNSENDVEELAQDVYKRQVHDSYYHHCVCGRVLQLQLFHVWRADYVFVRHTGISAGEE